MRTLQEVMDKYPRLTDNGFVSLKHPEYEKRRAALLRDIDDVERARHWMAKRVKNKTLCKSYSSYYIKHIVEKSTGKYLTNGSLIAGAILAGFRIDDDWELNCYFNISKREFKHIMAGLGVIV